MILHFGLCITYRVLFHPSKSAGIHSHAGAFRLVQNPPNGCRCHVHPADPCGSFGPASILCSSRGRRRLGFVTGCRRRFCTRSWRRCSTACGCDSAPAPWSGQPGNCGIDTGSTWVKITTFLWLTHVNSLFLMARWTNWRTSRIKQETPSKQVWQCA